MVGLKTAQPGQFGGVGCQLMPPIRKSKAPMAKPTVKRMTRLLIPLPSLSMSKLTLRPKAALAGTSTSWTAPSRRIGMSPSARKAYTATPGYD